MSHIYILAGEASGDYLGSRLMKALKKQDPALTFQGVGGPLMEAQGLSSLFPFSDLTHMGLIEVLKHLRTLRRRLHQVIQDIESSRPRVLVTIDSPDFSFQLGKAIKKSLGDSVTWVHYVAPSVWAWRPHRARKLASCLDHLLALFDFEPPYFKKEGLPCTFVGHPLMEEDLLDKKETLGKEFWRRHGLDPRHPLLCLLPGSRASEVQRLLPLFLQTFTQLRDRFPNLQGVLPVAPSVASLVETQVRDQKNLHLLSDPSDKWGAFAASTVALAASGTVTLELGLMKVPTCITYRVAPLTAWVLRHLIKTPYVGLPNILLNNLVMPEFLQEKCKVDFLVPALASYLEKEEERQVVQKHLQDLPSHLGQGALPSVRSAQVILNFLSSSS